MEKAFPYATRLLVVGKRDAGSDAPAKVQSSREQVKTCSLLLCLKFCQKPLDFLSSNYYNKFVELKK
nr:MAG TPA: hypothetical protein [Caudoviricetes sp.]